jgi:hypothetical protein
MNRLLEIGFRLIGQWKIKRKKLDIELTAMMKNKNVLYAFVSNGEVKYIGKTIQSLQRRMYGYQNPGPTQRTNIRNHALLKELLFKGETVEIFALPDNGLLHYGGFHINLAAGLEDSLVRTIRPPWNSTGKTKPGKGKRTRKKDDRLVIFKNTVNPVFELKLHKTYFEKGFFNVTVEFDRFLGSNLESIHMHIGETEETISGYINRTANKNGTARIMGGKELREWFQAGFQEKDTVFVEILSPTSLRMGKFQK